jgi:hypothetical protein
MTGDIGTSRSRLIAEQKLRQWTEGKSLVDARISIFYAIRDIPYAVVPELNNYRNYMDILVFNRGSCTPKHLLLGYMFQRLGLDIFYAVYPFKWSDFAALYEPELQQLAAAMPICHHLVCKLDLDSRLVLVDATIDTSLGKLGLPVNLTWDGCSDTSLAVIPCGEEMLYHPSEAELMVPRVLSETEHKFFVKLNRFLDQVRYNSH